MTARLVHTVGILAYRPAVTLSNNEDPLLGPSMAALATSIELTRASPECIESMGRLMGVLGLLRYGLSLTSQGRVGEFPNTVAAVSCFARAYHGIQASALLCVTANYTEARTLIRGVYEAAGLGRTLAHESELAEKWLHSHKWLSDKFARSYQKSFTTADPNSDRNYGSYYQAASNTAHVTVKSTVPYAFNHDARVNLTFGSVSRSEQLISVLREIVIMALFTCFCLRNACTDSRLLGSKWNQALADIAKDVSGKELPHLNQDWSADDEFLTRFLAHVRHDEDLNDALTTDPTAYDNVRKRMEEGKDAH